MAKKQKEEVEVPVVETPIVETPKPKRVEPTNPVVDGWEIKDRTYRLMDGSRPLTYTFKNRGIYYFDEEKGFEREIMYTRNQNTVFVDEFKGDVRPGRIVFRNGILFVPKNQRTLQMMLSIYHPWAEKAWFEVKPREKAKSELETLDLELDAMIAAREMDIDMAEAIMRVEVGSSVSKMSSKELKRDLLVFAKNKPALFLDLMKDDGIHLRNIGIKATEMGILKLSDDNRVFTWASTDRRLLKVPFEEHPYSALSQWFKTDEGMEVLTSIEKQLK